VSWPRVLPLGDAALSVELGDSLDPAINARVRALDRELAVAPFDGFREAVPTHRSLLVLYDPLALRFAAVEKELRARAGRLTAPASPGRLHQVPAVYGGAHGPDLAALARERGIGEGELAALHASQEYTAFMLGFMPGFAYLGLVPEPLAAPRRATPRVRVPAGSIGIAGRQTGIYPVASPGGWQLVGRTSRRLFDPFRAEPALIAAGDRVRFLPVDELPPPEEPAPAPQPAGSAALAVRDAGLLTTVQDGGRSGHRRYGVSGAGPMDARAHAAANRVLGNPESAAALECTVSGPTLEMLSTVWLAVAGADLGAVLERADLGSWPVPLGAAFLARPGNLLRFAGRRCGCRATIAFQGGVDVPEVLGSRSTDLPSGFGGLAGRPLAPGDRLVVGRSGRDIAGRPAQSAAPAPSATVRVVLGPQAAGIEKASLELFLGGPFRVGPTSDRVGCRLEGPVLRHRGPAEILSDGMVPGSIQVPPDGRPIVMMADAPTTGGYPKIATVVTADLSLLAQLVPGEGEVRFEAVSVEESQE
jgi:antagonist of KipI